MFRLRKEVALADGAKNMLKILSEQKKPDLKSTKDAFETRTQAEEKIDLIRLSLKKYTYGINNSYQSYSNVSLAMLYH